MRKVWIALICLGVLAHAFSLAVLPDSAYSDSAVHIRNSVEFNLTSIYYIIPSLIYMFVPAVFPFTKIMPAIATALLLLTGYLLLKQEFGKNYIIPFALLASLPWLIRYGSVNYLGVLGAAFLMGALYLKQKKDLDSFAIVWLCLLFTKVNAALVGIFICVPEKLRRNSFYGFLGVFLAAMLFLDIPGSLLSILDFPPVGAFIRFEMLAGVSYLGAALLFSLMVLPMGLVALKGLLQTRESLYAQAFMFLFAVFALGGVFWRGDTMLLYVRWLIPVLPFISIFYMRGLSETKGWFRDMAILSTVLYCFYSYSMTAISAMVYAGVL